MAFDFIVSALGLVQQSLFTKSLNFRPQCVARIYASLIAGTAAIALAATGFGVWSLVIQTMLGNAIAVGTYWFLGRWRPSLHFRLRDLRKLFGFGSKLLVSGALDVVFQNIYSVVIGRAFSATELGLYSRAQQISTASHEQHWQFG
jgi:O-antigen/teichoic acid export membrane protein